MSLAQRVASRHTAAPKGVSLDSPAVQGKIQTAQAIVEKATKDLARASQELLNVAKGVTGFDAFRSDVKDSYNDLNGRLQGLHGVLDRIDSLLVTCEKAGSGAGGKNPKQMAKLVRDAAKKYKATTRQSDMADRDYHSLMGLADLIDRGEIAAAWRVASLVLETEPREEIPREVYQWLREESAKR